MNKEPTNLIIPELRPVYDKDFTTYLGTGVKTIFVNTEYIIMDIFIDEPPIDIETLRANSDQSRPPIFDRRILARFMIPKDTALLLADKLMIAHRLMSGPPPEAP